MRRLKKRSWRSWSAPDDVEPARAFVSKGAVDVPRCSIASMQRA
jgi:hypothetical protein